MKKPSDEIVFPIDIEDSAKKLIASVKPFTMTSIERIYGIIKGVDYIVCNDIEGDIVECGVWKGGSMMTVAKRLLEHNAGDRNLWLYDTFEGMPKPSDQGYSLRSGHAYDNFLQKSTDGRFSDWCRYSLDDVKTSFQNIPCSEKKFFS